MQLCAYSWIIGFRSHAINDTSIWPCQAVDKLSTQDPEAASPISWAGSAATPRHPAHCGRLRALAALSLAERRLAAFRMRTARSWGGSLPSGSTSRGQSLIDGLAGDVGLVFAGHVLRPAGVSSVLGAQAPLFGGHAAPPTGCPCRRRNFSFIGNAPLHRSGTRGAFVLARHTAA
jgi:hypothetical protein